MSKFVFECKSNRKTNCSGRRKTKNVAINSISTFATIWVSEDCKCASVPLDLFTRERNARHFCGCCLSVWKSTLFLDILIVRRLRCVVGRERKCIDVFRNQRRLSRMLIHFINQLCSEENKFFNRYDTRERLASAVERPSASEFITAIKAVYILFSPLFIDYNNNRRSLLLLV